MIKPMALNGSRTFRTSCTCLKPTSTDGIRALIGGAFAVELTHDGSNEMMQRLRKTTLHDGCGSENPRFGLAFATTAMQRHAQRLV